MGLGMNNKVTRTSWEAGMQRHVKIVPVLSCVLHRCYMCAKYVPLSVWLIRERCKTKMKHIKFGEGSAKKKKEKN